MKTIIFHISLILFPMFIVRASFAQKAGSNNESAFKFSSNTDNKSLLLSGSKLADKIESVNVTKKILKNFNKNYHDVIDVKWEQGNGTFLAIFYENKILYKTLFSKNGKIIYTIYFGPEKQLPADIRGIVKSQYYDYKIIQVVNIMENQRQIWVVYMGGDLNYVTVRIENGEMEEVQNFKRAD
ncbi:MAG: hypothetical protein M3015_03095 [Bacteroidota bacterium]|nr:hypothetical protein [Bacteroidota bacterium]